MVIASAGRADLVELPAESTYQTGVPHFHQARANELCATVPTGVPTGFPKKKRVTAIVL